MDNSVMNHKVLKLFSEISKIPRESGNEKAISDWIKAWAEERNLHVTQDEIYDLIIKKPASSGFEDHPAVLMQAHTDMVCEKNSDSKHDFAKDPIELEFDGEWIRSASGTTLGADDGIGVAAALATGGAGAIFWMWAAAVCGTGLIYAENVLACRWRRADAAGGRVPATAPARPVRHISLRNMAL